MKYEEAAKVWGEQKLTETGIPFDEVSHVNFTTYTDVGCPTCGPETSYEGDIWYYAPGDDKAGRKTLYEVEFYGLEEILRELFEVSA